MPGTLPNQAFRALGVSGGFVTLIPGSTQEYRWEESTHLSHESLNRGHDGAFHGEMLGGHTGGYVKVGHIMVG